MSEKIAANAGVHNITGIDFQKHAILYLIFENFESLKDKKYFICIEHHDDFLFCFENKNEIVKIDSYQAKKSSDKWGMSKGFIELFYKVLATGVKIDDDQYPKTKDYSQNLFFITNNTISLSVKENDITYNDYINETRTFLNYIDIKPQIKEILMKKLRLINDDNKILSKINNVNLLYIDFARTVKSQKAQLVGLFQNIFGQQVYDHKAAIDLLIDKLRVIESEFNQNAKPTLINYKKRIDSKEINETFDLITSKKKAFDLWRGKKESLSKIFKITISEQSTFELDFDNSFDLFKDLKQFEHQKILEYVFSKKEVLVKYYTDTECIEEIYQGLKKDLSSTLNTIQTKAAIFAAYIEMKDLA